MKFFAQIFFKGLFYFITNKNFRIFFYQNVLFLFKFQNKIFKFKKFQIEYIDFKSFIWQFYEIFFKNYYTFNSKIKNPIIIDCGSNIGLSILNFKIQYIDSEIHAFEADKNVYNILNNNIIRNNLGNVNLYNKAVWIKNEDLNFDSDGIDGGQINLTSKSENIVKGIDLREFLNQFERIDFLKIDIEGAEVFLLPHIESCLEKVESIFVEYHSFKGKEQKMNEVLGLLSKYFRLYIHNPEDKFSPFLDTKKHKVMDLQLNIFGKNISKS